MKYDTKFSFFYVHVINTENEFLIFQIDREFDQICENKTHLFLAQRQNLKQIISMYLIRKPKPV